MHVLTPILAAHGSNPAAAQLITAAKSLSSVPAAALYTVTIHQTPASVAQQVSTVRHDLTLLAIAGIWLPVGVGVIGLLLLGLAFRPRRRARAPRSDEPVTAWAAGA